MDPRVVHVAMVLMILCTLNTQVNTMKIGDACQSGAATEEACNDIDGTICQGGTCRCLSLHMYVGDDGGTICTKVPIGGFCAGATENAAQCSKIDNTMCVHGFCVCKSGYYGTDGSTTCTAVNVGDICSVSDPGQLPCSVTPGGVCVNGKCACAGGMYAVDITPYVCSSVNVGDICSVSDPGQLPCSVTPGGVCVDGKCACAGGMYAVDITPYFCSSVRIGDDCAQSAAEADCLRIPNAECTDKECQCKHGFGGVEGSTLCTPEATVRCSKSGNEMIMEIRAIKDANHQQIVTAKGAGDLTTSDCKTSTFGTNKEFLELTIKVNMDTGEQTSPVKTASDCFVTKVQGESSTVFYTLVVGQGDPAWVKGTDKFYKVVCNSNTANGEEVVLEDVGITSAIDPTEKTSESDDVTLELVKADDNTALGTSVSLTEEVKLKVILTRKALVTAPLGLFLHDVHVSDKAEMPTNTLKLLNEFGCVQDTAAFKLESTFAPVDTSIVAASATKYEALTGKFNLALFEGMEELKLFFSVEYEASCFVNTEDKCFDLQQYCTDNTQDVTNNIIFPPNFRRRRSATEVKNGTATLGVSVYLGGPRAANQDGVVSDLHTKDECQTSQYFLIVAVVLGCLALAALLFAFFLFRRLRREQKRSDKLDQKLGVRNLAF